jgi:glucuronoarabinoxylan endo-1,4-beta-xylanase
MNIKLHHKVITKNYLFVFFYLMCIPLFSQVFAQTVAIDGKVTSNRWPIKEALVTFIDDVDTTKKLSAITDNSGNYQIGLPTSIKSNNNNLPASFELAQNYPNPFSSSTAIQYNVKKQSDIKVTIYDMLGREVRKFRVGLQTAGTHKILWDGRNSFGQKVANGIYLYKVQAGSKSRVKKMVLNSGGKNFVPFQQADFRQMLKENHKTNELSDGINYTVRIENTDNTSPMIIPKQFDNIQVRNDTTINFTVDYITTATIDFDSLHQIIRGFGAANILQWRPDMTDSEIEAAFGTGYGQLGFTILRLRIQPEKNLWSTNIPTAKKAHDMGAIIIASPWNAPVEMRETINDGYRVRHDMYDEYAAHLDSFVTYMANNDVPIYGLSVQNEPDIGDWTQWTAEEMLTFMKYHAHLINGTKVMAPESYHFDRAYSDPILNDSAACANTDIICGHIYGGGLASYSLAEEKGKEVWMTEHLTGEDDSANDWSWAFPVAKEINDVMQAGMSAYVWWYIVRYYGPISDGEKEGDIKGTVTKKGYIMSQYSRFIRPGDYRVDSSVYPPTSTVHITAYRDSLSSKAVTVAINTNSTAKDVVFTIQNGITNTFMTYTTTEFKSLAPGEEIIFNDNKFKFNLEASSITTFVLEP